MYYWVKICITTKTAFDVSGLVENHLIYLERIRKIISKLGFYFSNQQQ